MIGLMCQRGAVLVCYFVSFHRATAIGVRTQSRVATVGHDSVRTPLGNTRRQLRIAIHKRMSHDFVGYWEVKPSVRQLYSWSINGTLSHTTTTRTMFLLG